MITILYIILWFMIGYYGFKYYWSKVFCFTDEDKYFGLSLAAFGLITVYASWVWYITRGKKIINNRKENK